MNMDVNLRRLPGLFSYRSKFLVPLADIIQHPYSADRAVILSKQRKDILQFPSTQYNKNIIETK